ncbi:response regulator [Lichenibacterium ramalinae]|uniref:Response regulator n=1 Tax=Lichenibacterium ramalinae TaxID=2316527 RepID=A0A4Q2RGZ5_9HYPH|nr:response regulator [Lichenibacterium ramalinae]RYB06974.1 response regulator [Lichenibacterium ramalinae]
MAQIHNSWSGRTVVIVEDEFLVRDLAVCELEENGFIVVEFDSADAALPYLREHGGEAALVLTDVQMPGDINGLDLVAILAHLWPGVPVLITSGGPLVDPRKLPPCAAFLSKPWRPEDMVERVAGMLARVH